MNNKLVAALVVTASTIGIWSSAYGQSVNRPNSNSSNYTVNGDSLTGINNRTAEDDYARFFSGKNSENTSSRTVEVSPRNVWQISDEAELRPRENLTTPNNIIFPQSNESLDGNDGVEVQLTPRSRSKR